MKRRWRWVALGMLLLAVALGGSVWRAGSDNAAASTPPRHRIDLAGLLHPPAVLWAGVDRAASGVGGESPMAASGAAHDTSDDEPVDVCGVGRFDKRQIDGWSPRERREFEARAQAMDARKGAAMSQLSAWLAVGTDSQRVAARFVMGDREGAAMVAARSSDPAAYRLGMLGCGLATEQTAPSCRGLTVDGWMRLDSEDATPWLRRVGEAMARQDEVAATEAVEQVLQRRRRSPSRPLMLAVHQAHANVQDQEGLGMAMVEIVGREAAMPDAASGVLGRYCRAEAVKDEPRRVVCERVARWQFEHADSLIDGMVAAGIAERVGLPPEQRPYTRKQLGEAMQRLADQAGWEFGPDCNSLRNMALIPAKLVQQNELEAALALIPKP